MYEMQTMMLKLPVLFVTLYFINFTESNLLKYVDEKSFPDHSPLSDDLINYVNNEAKTTWKAGRTNRFKSISDIRKVLGVIDDPNINQHPVKMESLNAVNLPTSFDARTQWPGCKSITEIRDQSVCGSCWAFGAVESMTDRYCIHSNGTQTPEISAEDLLTCCGLICGFGCNGGFPPTAWRFWVTDGLVTGGAHGSHRGCQDYAFPVDSSRQKFSTSVPTPQCEKKCQPGYPNTYEADKHFGKNYYIIFDSEKFMMKEIMTNGPIEGTLIVYGDLFNYKVGIYQHVTGHFEGLHAVKIIGWGVDNNIPYWLIANSWDYSWGENGFFKIKRGSNECGIEVFATAGLPKL